KRCSISTTKPRARTSKKWPSRFRIIQPGHSFSPIPYGPKRFIKHDVCSRLCTAATIPSIRRATTKSIRTSWISFVPSRARRGCATLERVAKEGRWVDGEAKTLLIVLYTREKRFAEAATFARELAAKYPRNYLYRLEAADALVSQAAQERANHATVITATENEAFATFESLLKDKSVRDTAAREFDLIHFKYGEALMTAGQYERAAKEFLASAETQGAQQGLATMAHLYAARALDLAGKRNDALNQYRAVLARPDGYDAHDQWQLGLT